ncbi:unnamed protein product [Choristocarpus tenellus]
MNRDSKVSCGSISVTRTCLITLFLILCDISHRGFMVARGWNFFSGDNLFVGCVTGRHNDQNCDPDNHLCCNPVRPINQRWKLSSRTVNIGQALKYPLFICGTSRSPLWHGDDT